MLCLLDFEEHTHCKGVCLLELAEKGMPKFPTRSTTLGQNRGPVSRQDKGPTEGVNLETERLPAEGVI